MSDDGLLRSEITLPSGLKATVREMTGREEDILTSEKFAKSGRTIDILLSNVIEKLDGGNANEEAIANMWSADRSAALIESRKLTFGNVVTGAVKCSQCGEENHLEADLDSVEVKPTPEAFDTTILVGDKEVKLRSLKGKDERRIALSKAKDILTTALQVRLLSVDGVKEAQFKPWLQQLPLRLRDHLRRAAEELDFGPDTSIEFDCASCGHENKTDVTAVPAFFFITESHQ